MKSSIITIVDSLGTGLTAQAAAIEASAIKPDEWVVVSLGPPRFDLSTSWPTKVSYVDSESPRAAAAARARGVRESSAANLIFLDQGLIPHRELSQVFPRMLETRDAIWMGTTTRNDQQLSDTLSTSNAAAFAARSITACYDQFRSGCFAITRTSYRKIGGFDPTFGGWDAEDIDFAYAARDRGIEFGIVGTLAVSLLPRVRLTNEQVVPVVESARRFRSKWGEWPNVMRLRRLANLGLVEFNAARDHIRVLCESSTESRGVITH